MGIIDVNHSSFNLTESDKNEYNYQPYLTEKLDQLTAPFSQEVMNEIVLWKVNRFALFNDEILSQLNKIKPDAVKVDQLLVRDILKGLLNIHGVGLPMASTILRFRNKNVFQIIDKRVYRIVYGRPFKESISTSDKKVNERIDLYLNYLKEIEKTCKFLDIQFSESDRILYMADKRLNKDISIS